MQLCRSLLRPPLAQHRVQLRADGRGLVALKTVWRAGPSRLLFEPIEFMETLAALIPRPAVTLGVSHGGLAPHARWRRQVVSSGRPAPDPTAHEVDTTPHSADGPSRSWTLAASMRRVFALDVLACPRCGGRLPVIATIQDPVAVRTILAHLGPSGAAEPPGPAPPAPIPIGSPGHSAPLSTLAGAPLRPHGRSLTARR